MIKKASKEVRKLLAGFSVDVSLFVRALYSVHFTRNHPALSRRANCKEMKGTHVFMRGSLVF
jgi:hypothetical protein